MVWNPSGIGLTAGLALVIATVCSSWCEIGRLQQPQHRSTDVRAGQQVLRHSPVTVASHRGQRPGRHQIEQQPAPVAPIDASPTSQRGRTASPLAVPAWLARERVDDRRRGRLGGRRDCRRLARLRAGAERRRAATGAEPARRSGASAIAGAVRRRASSTGAAKRRRDGVRRAPARGAPLLDVPGFAAGADSGGWRGRGRLGRRHEPWRAAAWAGADRPLLRRLERHGRQELGRDRRRELHDLGRPGRRAERRDRRRHDDRRRRRLRAHRRSARPLAGRPRARPPAPPARLRPDSPARCCPARDSRRRWPPGTASPSARRRSAAARTAG